MREDTHACSQICVAEIILRFGSPSPGLWFCTVVVAVFSEPTPHPQQLQVYGNLVPGEIWYPVKAVSWQEQKRLSLVFLSAVDALNICSGCCTHEREGACDQR